MIRSINYDQNYQRNYEYSHEGTLLCLRALSIHAYTKKKKNARKLVLDNIPRR